MTTVMIVEDEPLIRLTLADMLSDDGFTVLSAANGRQALDMLEETPADILLSDIQMPVMTGIELVSRLVTAHSKMRMVLMTGFSPEAIPDTFRARGIKVLSKPLDLENIGAILRAQSLQPPAAF